jgi:hypothetical protein
MQQTCVTQSTSGTPTKTAHTGYRSPLLISTEIPKPLTLNLDQDCRQWVEVSPGGVSLQEVSPGGLANA